MAENKGWICIHRHIQDNALWEADEPFDRRSAWIDLLLMANNKTKSFVYRVRNVTVKRGQVYTSIRKLAAKWHWGKDKTLRYIRLLEELDMIKRHSETDSATLITIVNYGIYQDIRDTKRDSNKDTHKDTHKDTSEDTNKPLLNNNNNNNNDKQNNKAHLSAEDDFVSDEEWQRRLAEQDDDW